MKNKITHLKENYSIDTEMNIQHLYSEISAYVISKEMLERFENDFNEAILLAEETGMPQILDYSGEKRLIIDGHGCSLVLPLKHYSYLDNCKYNSFDNFKECKFKSGLYGDRCTRRLNCIHDKEK